MNTDIRYLKRYLSFLKPYSGQLTITFLIIPFIALLHLLRPLLIKSIIDDYLTLHKPFHFLIFLVLLFFLLIVGEVALRMVQSFLLQRVGESSVADIRESLFKKIIYSPIHCIEQNSVGNTVNALTSDTIALSESFNSGLITLLSDMIILIGIIVFMSFLHLKMTLYFLCSLPIIFIVVNFFRFKLRFCFSRIRSQTGMMSHYLEEQIQGYEVIQNDQDIEQHTQRFSDKSKNVCHWASSAALYDCCLYSFMESLAPILSALLFIGLSYNQELSISIGTTVAFIDYIFCFCTPLKDFANKFATLQRALAALEKVFSYHDSIVQEPLGDQFPVQMNEGIRFEQVSFAYERYPDKQVLKKITLEVKKGQVVAFVGPTGSGKTSLVRLLVRLYEGYTGSIFIDRTDIQKLSLQTLRSHISVVLQDNHLFFEDMQFNLFLDKPIPQNKVEKLKSIFPCEDLPIFKFLFSPESHTINPQKLSSGEIQLISLIRALLSDAPILILDEATALIDQQLEICVQKALHVLFQQKTVLVIAHRLSTIQTADCIFALHDGQIVESGTHKQLMSNKDFYYHLFRIQFLSSNI